KMQWIEPRDAQQGKLARSRRAGPYRVGVEPEEHEARKREEEVDRRPPLEVERLQQPEERLHVARPAVLEIAADREEMFPMPAHDGERRDAAQRIQRSEAPGLHATGISAPRRREKPLARKCRNRAFLHPYLTARSVELPPHRRYTPPPRQLAANGSARAQQ